MVFLSRFLYDKCEVNRMDIILSIIGMAVIGVCGYISAQLRDLPKLIREKMLEKDKATNAKNLQVEAYFRQINGSNLSKVFETWTSFLMDLDKLRSFMSGTKGEKAYKDLLQSTFINGSPETVHILAVMSQHIYQNVSIESKVDIKMSKEIDDFEEEVNNFQLVVFLSKLIVSLKKDFTGYEIDSDEIIEMKINDIHKKRNEKSWKESVKRVNKKLAK